MTTQPTTTPGKTTQPTTMPGRVALVTGAARGIGAAIARRLARDGFAVAAVDTDAEGSARTANSILESGGRAIAVGADVTHEQESSRAVARASAELGPVTALVNNAGILRDNMLFKMSTEDWDAVLNVHLRGAFLMTRAAQAHMIEAKWGRIVNLSSTSALGKRGQANYAAAKAGLQGFTKTLALELGKFGVTANAIAPGFIDTEMVHAMVDRMGVEFDDWKTAAGREIAVGRVGTPDDVAAVAGFLCSDDAAYVSGQVIYVAGGPRG
ncbi:MAG: 3-oxoacyl-ACP reductase FabG [Microlunatus sp.]|nr:3-oxoacyl-ACP reductase FabG [Microlunatus sp.]MDN5772131.1 3-oxoacyl-ACP reductase FabG [Microlunatus sp.]